MSAPADIEFQSHFLKEIVTQLLILKISVIVNYVDVSANNTIFKKRVVTPNSQPIGGKLSGQIAAIMRGRVIVEDRG